MSAAVPLLPPWILMALVAAYYVRILARDHAPAVPTWLLCAGACLLSASVVAAVSGWIAAVTVFLALAGLIPFGLTWFLCLRELLGRRAFTVTAGVFLSCALTPFCVVAVFVGLVLCGVSLSVGDTTWAAVGAIGTAGAVLLVIGAAVPTRRARRAAREALSTESPGSPVDRAGTH